VRESGGHVVHTGVLAVDRAESVVHIGLGERGQLVRERAPLGVVLAGLARVEAEVFQQRDVAGCEARGHRLRRRADRVGRERDRALEQLTQALGDRLERVPGVGRALGAAQVGHDGDPGTRLAERAQRRQHRTDAPVVSDRRAIQRNVEVGAHEHAPTLDALGEEVVQRFHQSEEPTSLTRSTMRLE
jgi:hypothetical protein